ncbi:hypothetical protein Dda_6969 [Drechslerella dactyloides]|uniref:Uncharacterized protein n=1 Tax=Drechslerella dactyloides TaxID=74499 RepID=A0AAD6IX89_DREDA|nr:hypothetical protein Dda_6969 [Drechslerella dactyloides]
MQSIEMPQPSFIKILKSSQNTEKAVMHCLNRNRIQVLGRKNKSIGTSITTSIKSYVKFTSSSNGCNKRSNFNYKAIDFTKEKLVISNLM